MKTTRRGIIGGAIAFCAGLFGVRTVKTDASPCYAVELGGWSVELERAHLLAERIKRGAVDVVFRRETYTPQMWLKPDGGATIDITRSRVWIVTEAWGKEYEMASVAVIGKDGIEPFWRTGHATPEPFDFDAETVDFMRRQLNEPTVIKLTGCSDDATGSFTADAISA